MGRWHRSTRQPAAKDIELAHFRTHLGGLKSVTKADLDHRYGGCTLDNDETELFENTQFFVYIPPGFIWN